jgi:hypothetical protein
VQPAVAEPVPPPAPAVASAEVPSSVANPAGEPAPASTPAVLETPATSATPAPELAPGQIGPDGWPVMALNAVMSLSDPAKSQAMLNNELLNVGDSVQGVKLIEIRENGVTLEFNGEQRFIKIRKAKP